MAKENIVLAGAVIVFFAFMGKKLLSDDLVIEPLNIKDGDTPELISRANAVLPVIINTCPGIQRYASEFEFIRAEAATQRGFEYGIALHFLVKNPNNLPPRIKGYSAGHHCWISIDPFATHLDIAKRACQSVCLGKKVN